MEYKASLDRLSIVMTVMTFLLLAWAAFKLLHSPDLMAFVLIGAAVVTICYGLHTQKYVIGNGMLLIHRPVKNVSFPTADIQQTKILEPNEMTGTIRAFGVGGLFGYFGKFYNRKFGFMTFYTTQRKNRILIQFKSGKKIIISPDDVSIINYLKEK